MSEPIEESDIQESEVWDLLAQVCELKSVLNEALKWLSMRYPSGDLEYKEFISRAEIALKKGE